LRSDPVLAIAAVEIAAEHAEAVSERAGISMEKRLLLNRVALHSPDIAPRHVKLPTLVVADFADSRLTFRNGTTMTAGKAADPIAFDRLVQFAFVDVLVKDFAEGRQLKPLPLF
jgi:hypothetical protein